MHTRRRDIAPGGAFHSDRGLTMMAKSHTSTPPPAAPIALPGLARSKQHELVPGMVCHHLFLTDEKWVIESVSGFWCSARRGAGDGVRQRFPCDVMVPIPPREKRHRGVVKADGATHIATHPKEAKETPKRPPRRAPPKVGFDDVAARLAEADTLDECWALAGVLGVPNDKKTRASKAHLNNGLQRMWIGNQARKLRKAKA